MLLIEYYCLFDKSSYPTSLPVNDVFNLFLIATKYWNVFIGQLEPTYLICVAFDLYETQIVLDFLESNFIFILNLAF